MSPPMVTIATVREHLERFGVPVRPGTDEQGLTATWAVQGQAYELRIALYESGRLSLVVPGLVRVTADDTPADRVHGLLLALAVLNDRISLGTLCYDLVEGQVRLRYALPVHGGDPDYEDLASVLTSLRAVLADHVDGLRAVVAGERTAREILG